MIWMFCFKCWFSNIFTHYFHVRILINNQIPPNLETMLIALTNFNSWTCKKFSLLSKCIEAARMQALFLFIKGNQSINLTWAWFIFHISNLNPNMDKKRLNPENFWVKTTLLHFELHLSSKKLSETVILFKCILMLNMLPAC